MFGIGFPEFVVIAIVCILFVRPDNIATALRSVGKVVGTARKHRQDLITSLHDDPQMGGIVREMRDAFDGRDPSRPVTPAQDNQDSPPETDPPAPETDPPGPETDPPEVATDQPAERPFRWSEIVPPYANPEGKWIPWRQRTGNTGPPSAPVPPRAAPRDGEVGASSSDAAQSVVSDDRATESPARDD